VLVDLFDVHGQLVLLNRDFVEVVRLEADDVILDLLQTGLVGVYEVQTLA